MRRKPKEPMLLSYGFWSYSNMRLYLTYFPLFFFNFNFNFLRKKYFSVAKHTDYEFNLKLKKAVKTNLKCYKLHKIRVFFIQREIEY